MLFLVDSNDRPDLRDWLVILASVPKYLVLVLQSKTSKETGARRRPWRQRESFGMVSRWTLRGAHCKKFFVEWVLKMKPVRGALEVGLYVKFEWELDARTFYPGAPHKYVLAAQGRRAWAMTCFKGLVSDFGFRAKITNASFAKQN